MSGECVFDLIASEPQVSDAAYQQANGRSASKGGKGFKSRKAAPPTASTFGIHGTSAVVGNMGGEHTEPSIHPARKPVGTFGREVGPTVDPANFLKKNEGPFTASRGAPTVNSTKFVKSEYNRDKNKADIPNRYEKPVMGLKTDKNYVVANAVENMLAIPTKAMPAAEPRATERADFGQVPEYLGEIKAEVQNRRDMIQSYNVQLKMANERWSELTEAELAELRAGLQRRWDVLNKDYQSRGFSKLQTPSQQAHQVAVEKELRAVEYAMQKLSRTHVFVYNDQK